MVGGDLPEGGHRTAVGFFGFVLKFGGSQLIPALLWPIGAFDSSSGGCDGYSPSDGQRMGREPQRASAEQRVDSTLLPPGCFIA